MAPTIIRLVDGAFFEALLKEYSRLLSVDLLDGFRWDVFGSGALRCIYYDALPTRKSDQSEEDFDQRVEEKLRFLNGIRSLPNMHVRDGITRLRTKQSGNKMSEVFEQKGVDTWIAVDAMQYALNGIADEIEVYTSDADLYPVFEALQNTKCRGKLWYSYGRASEQLIYSADSSHEFDVTRALSWSRFSGLGAVQSRIILSWKRKIHEVTIGSRRIEFFIDGSDRYGANIWESNSFNASAVSKSLYPLLDWVRPYGCRISYADGKSLLD